MSSWVVVGMGNFWPLVIAREISQTTPTTTSTPVKIQIGVEIMSISSLVGSIATPIPTQPAAFVNADPTEGAPVVQTGAPRSRGIRDSGPRQAGRRM